MNSSGTQESTCGIVSLPVKRPSVATRLRRLLCAELVAALVGTVWSGLATRLATLRWGWRLAMVGDG